MLVNIVNDFHILNISERKHPHGCGAEISEP